ncbi:hypothetical protein FACS1894132_04870 [Clostridia bacterium]|nr:hypothetical protein FACS1894132_04870 [Clostridia bacterium]
MTKEEVTNGYFEWLCSFVDTFHNRNSYHKLLEYLHTIDFFYTIEMDGNREEDGIELRYRFCNERSYDSRIILSYLDIRQCSVLEMMVALAVRCEEHIMADPLFGDRTALWFWSMIDSLGLIDESDDQFHERRVFNILLTFLNRRYKKNGDGGLFKIEYSLLDLREIEIWYQMCLYLERYGYCEPFEKESKS